MNMLDARALRYQAQEDATRESSQSSPSGSYDPDRPPAGWRELGKTKQVTSTDEFAAMMGGKVNKLMRT